MFFGGERKENKPFFIHGNPSYVHACYGGRVDLLCSAYFLSCSWRGVLVHFQGMVRVSCSICRGGASGGWMGSSPLYPRYLCGMMSKERKRNKGACFFFIHPLHSNENDWLGSYVTFIFTIHPYFTLFMGEMARRRGWDGRGKQPLPKFFSKVFVCSLLT